MEPVPLCSGEVIVTVEHPAQMMSVDWNTCRANAIVVPDAMSIPAVKSHAGGQTRRHAHQCGRLESGGGHRRRMAVGTSDRTIQKHRQPRDTRRSRFYLSAHAARTCMSCAPLCWR